MKLKISQWLGIYDPEYMKALRSVNMDRVRYKCKFENDTMSIIFLAPFKFDDELLCENCRSKNPGNFIYCPKCLNCNTVEIRKYKRHFLKVRMPFFTRRLTGTECELVMNHVYYEKNELFRVNIKLTEKQRDEILSINPYFTKTGRIALPGHYISKYLDAYAPALYAYFGENTVGSIECGRIIVILRARPDSPSSCLTRLRHGSLGARLPRSFAALLQQLNVKPDRFQYVRTTEPDVACPYGRMIFSREEHDQ